MKKFFFIVLVLGIGLALFYEYGSNLNSYDDYENSTNAVEDGFSGEDNSNVDLEEAVDKSDWTHGGLVPPNPNPDEIPPAPDDIGYENSSSNQSSERTGMVHFLDHNPYGDSFQCERCGELSQSKDKPRNFPRCYNNREGGSHDWEYADTNGGYRCTGGCGIISYLINEDGYKEPSGGQFGKCISTRFDNNRFHSWSRL